MDMKWNTARKGNFIGILRFITKTYVLIGNPDLIGTYLALLGNYSCILQTHCAMHLHIYTIFILYTYIYIYICIYVFPQYLWCCISLVMYCIYITIMQNVSCIINLSDQLDFKIYLIVLSYGPSLIAIEFPMIIYTVFKQCK